MAAVQNHRRERDAGIKDEHLKITTDGEKLYGHAVYKGVEFNTFAYLRGNNLQDAKTSIRMEWQMKKYEMRLV